MKQMERRFEEPNLLAPGGIPARTAKLGACTWAYVWKSSIEESLDALRALGYDAIDVLTIPPHPFPTGMSNAERSALRTFTQQHGVSIETLNIPSTDVNLCSVNRDMRQYTIDQIRRTLELANDLAVPMVTTVPGRRLNFNAPDQATTNRWLAECLEQLVPAAESLGVDILLELHPLSCLPRTHALTGFLTTFNSDRLGIALDVTNAAHAGDDPAQSVRHAARWLRQVHLSDTMHDKWQHDVIGAGDIDFVSIFSAIDDSGIGVMSIVEITCEDPDWGYSVSRAKLENFGWRV
jgi:deoxyribonuclease-4